MFAWTNSRTVEPSYDLVDIETHVKAARKEGATDREIAEAIFVAAALRAGGAFAHSTIAMGVLKEAEGKW